MRNALFPSLFLLLAPALRAQDARTAPAEHVPAVGERLPPLALTGFAQTPAHALDDYYGRAVLLEFFANWCEPCAKGVPHLNKLQDEYGPRGFSIVAITTDSPAKIEPWIERLGARYAYTYDRESKVFDLFNVHAIPFGVLIDPFGTIVWIGAPSALPPELIERTLEGALEPPSWTWPAAAHDLVAPLAHGDYAAALTAARALASADGFDPVAIVSARVASAAAHFEHLIEREDYRGALSFGERAARELATLPEGERIAARTKELAADPQVQAALAALERLKALEQRASAVRSVDEAQKLRPEVAALVQELAGKKLERRAQKLLDAIDKSVERAGKKN